MKRGIVDLQQNGLPPPLPINKILVLLFAVIILLCAVSAFQDLVLNSKSNKAWMLSTDYEAGIYTWVSQLIMAMCALLLFSIGRVEYIKDRRIGAYWFAMAAVFLYLSLDESIAVHERVNGVFDAYLPQTDFLRFSWVAPAAVVCLLGLIAAIPFLRSLPKQTAMLFCLAGAIYVTGAIGLEALSAKVFMSVAAEDGDSRVFRLVTNLEELFEGLGLFVFLCAAIRHRAVHLQRDTVWA